MANTCDDLVRRHARISVLSAIAKVCSAAPEHRKSLHSIPARQVEVACRDVSVRLAVAAMEIVGHNLEIESVLQQVNAAVPRASTPTFLGADPGIQAVVGSNATFIEPDPMVTERAWLAARAAVESIALPQFVELLRSADIVVGLQGPWGEIRALSNPAFPGFVAIGVNAPPAILAEQAVHESMHVALSARLALDPACEPLRDVRLGVLSPFTDSVRTVERVVHGIMSYGAVLALWQRFEKAGSLAALLGVESNDQAAAVCERRVHTVGTRLALAELALRDAAGTALVQMTRSLFQELAGIAVPWSDGQIQARREVVSQAGWDIGLGDLGAIGQAEVILALRGQKVSRLSVPLRRSGKIGFGLLALGSVAASAAAVRPIHDERLEGFSNISGACIPVLDASPTDEIHLYISNAPHLAHSAAVLDRADEAGEILGIPACCRTSFERRWDSVRDAGGDMFADMLRSYARNGRVDVAVECDASAMYRGGGLCWHFPCSPMCENTIELVQTRRALLGHEDPRLLQNLDLAVAACVRLDGAGRYQVVSVGSNDDSMVRFTVLPVVT
jgi:hypothetical protein